MSDFSSHVGIGAKGILTPGSTPLGFSGFKDGGLYSNTTGTWTANKAVYQPILVAKPLTVYTIQIRVLTQNGNVDVGIYNWDNTKVISTGSTAVAAAGIQAFDIADTALAPGWYKIAFACSSATAVFRQNSTLTAGHARVAGVQQQSTAFALPDPLTPVAYAGLLIPLVVATYRATF